jgi:hypothetical protein
VSEEAVVWVLHRDQVRGERVVARPVQGRDDEGFINSGRSGRRG